MQHLWSMQNFCACGILFSLVLPKNSTYFKHTRSMQEKLLVRYHFPPNVRSHGLLFLHRSTMCCFNHKNVLNHGQIDSKITFFLYRPRQHKLHKKSYTKKSLKHIYFYRPQKHYLPTFPWAIILLHCCTKLHITTTASAHSFQKHIASLTNLQALII